MCHHSHVVISPKEGNGAGDECNEDDISTPAVNDYSDSARDKSGIQESMQPAVPRLDPSSQAVGTRLNDPKNQSQSQNGERTSTWKQAICFRTQQACPAQTPKGGRCWPQATEATGHPTSHHGTSPPRPGERQPGSRCTPQDILSIRKKWLASQTGRHMRQSAVQCCDCTCR